MAYFPIQLETDDDGSLLVTCPDLPEVTTFGADRAGARAAAGRAVEEALAARLADGLPLPPPRLEQPAGEAVRLPLQTALKVSLHAALREAGLTRAELARRLGWHRNSVDRLFDLDHGSRLEQLDAAFHALGRAVDLQVVEAA